MLTLRPYQVDAVEAVFRDWIDFDRVLLVLPTGTGKTIVFSHIAQSLVQQGKRVLILAHREELLLQAQDKLKLATGIDSSIEKANETAFGSLFMVTVGSVQTLMRPARLKRFPRDYYDTIIIDEAHHALAASYRSVLDYFSSAKILGVTATPDRGDKRNLGSYFESLAFEYSLPEAIRQKYLCPIKAQTVPLTIDLGHCRMVAGDFNNADLGSALDPYLGEIAQHMAYHLKDRKTVVFLPLINTSMKLTELLLAQGFRTSHIDGTSKDRADILSWFHAADPGSVLLNSMLLTEGWDEPTADCIVCLRPTKIRSLYTQIVGRGTRIHPNKSDLLLLDFLWHTDRHSLCKPSALLADDEDIADRMNAIQDAGGEPMALDELFAEAKSSAQHAREAALATALEKNRKRKSKLVDPLSWALETHNQQLEFYEPLFKWQSGKPTKKQLAYIHSKGFDPDGIKDKGHASLLIDSIITRSKSNLATPKQVALLQSFHVPNAETLPFTQASALITTIANNGWRYTP